MHTKPVALTKSVPSAVSTPTLRLLVLIMLSMTLAACGPKKTIIMHPQSEQASPFQPQYPVAPHINEARTLWDTGDTDTAANYFYAIATAPNNAVMKQSASYGQSTSPQYITKGQRAEAWQYYAMACVNQGKPQEALNALDQSLIQNPMVDQSATWQETWYAAVSQMDNATAMDLARAIYPDQKRPWPLRAEAGLLFALKQINTPNVTAPNLQSSTHLLAEIYASANPTWRASLEQQLYDALPSLDPVALHGLRGMVHTGNIGQFPYNVIQLQHVSATLDGTANITGSTENKTGGLSAAILQLQQQAYFENTQLMSVIHGGETSPASCLVLALPMSGSYAPIGLKVARGASAAQWNMSNEGRNVDVHLINTESASWIAQINALPSQCTTIGGPLRMSKYDELKASGVTDERAVFAFMAQLEQSATSTDEGSVAWRFFSSVDDQMRTLLNFTSSLGIKDYGILAPEEAYGRRMTSLFTNAVTSLGGSVTTTTYPPKEPGKWNGIVRQFIRNGSSAHIKAAFLPDSWNNMEMLVPNIFYHGKHSLVLLGTSIWSQGLGDGKNDVNNLSLAAFPSVWNPNATTGPAVALNDFLMQSGQDKADTWVGLGYDFVRFATALGVPQDWTAESLNAQLSSPLLSMEWSIAPITWTADGKASEDLFLFKPTVDGYELINEKEFAKHLKRVRSRHN